MGFVEILEWINRDLFAKDGLIIPACD